MKKKIGAYRFLVLLAALLTLSLIGYGCDGTGCDTNPPPPYDTYSVGPYTATVLLADGPSGASGVAYPDGAGPFPVFLFGCGGSFGPRMYDTELNHIASWGFVMIAQVATGTGGELINGLEWLTAQNADPQSPLYQKLDLSKVAAGGHSLGSISAFKIADDPRLSTTIHVAGGSLDGEGGNTVNLRNPTAYINASDDALGGTENALIDYEKTTVPIFMTIMEGIGHIPATGEGLPAITAWMLWHLKGETQRSGDFLNSDGEFQTGMWVSQAKNW